MLRRPLKKSRSDKTTSAIGYAFSNQMEQHQHPRKLTARFPTDVIDSRFDNNGHSITPSLSQQQQDQQQQQQQQQLQKQQDQQQNDVPSSENVYPFPVAASAGEVETVGWIVGVAVACGVLVFLALFCYIHHTVRRNRERERQKRVMHEIFKYIQAFDIDDIDIKRTPAGGYEIVYLNDLANFGGNLAPAGRTSTISSSARTQPSSTFTHSHRSSYKSSSSSRSQPPLSSSSSANIKKPRHGGTPEKSNSNRSRTLASPPPPPIPERGFSNAKEKSLDIADLGRVSTSDQFQTFENSDDYMFMSKDIAYASTDSERRDSSYGGSSYAGSSFGGSQSELP